MLNKRILFCLAALAALLPGGCDGGSSGSPTTPGVQTEVAVALTPAFPALAFNQPTVMVQSPRDNSRWFLAEKGGRIRTFANDPQAANTTLFVDISARVDSGPSEAGLLGIAFHPGFAENSEVFLSYTAPGTGPDAVLITRLSRFLSRDNGATLDPASEEILLTLEQPFANHNGGNIAFGPDGFLYLGLGDGGSAGDPQGNAQNVNTLLGAILRLDVTGAPPGTPYAIPADNPFAAGGGRTEIFAYGLRNPWRFTFDRATGDLWLGDVGQNAWEEIDLIVKGGNFGWNIREGAHCFQPPAGCPTAGLIDPVAEYTIAGTADCAVTGGYVYRGNAIPGLQGYYLFADFCTGILRALAPVAGGRPAGPPLILLRTGLNVPSFAEALDGEIFLLDLTGGSVQRLVAE